MKKTVYTEREDQTILTLRHAGLTFPDIVSVLPGRTHHGIAQRYYRLVGKMAKPPASAKRLRRKGTRERTCLRGDHPFDARLDDDGRFLEYICPDCKARNSVYDW